MLLAVSPPPRTAIRAFYDLVITHHLTTTLISKTFACQLQEYGFQVGFQDF